MELTHDLAGAAFLIEGNKHYINGFNATHWMQAITYGNVEVVNYQQNTLLRFYPNYTGAMTVNVYDHEVMVASYEVSREDRQRFLDYIRGNLLPVETWRSVPPVQEKYKKGRRR